MAVTKSEHGLSKDNESLAVTGTFYPETQPVSGAVTVSGTVSAKITDVSSGAQVAVGPYVQTPTGNRMLVQIGPGDVISNIPVMIDYPHHQIHEGETWQYGNQASLNGTRDFRILVAAVAATTRTPHLVIECVSDATTTTMALHEGVTWTSGGTEQTIFNRNRNVIGSPTTKVYAAGGTALTVNGTGTVIWTGYLWAGARSALGTQRDTSEWDLKSNTEYMFRVTTSAAGMVVVRLDFYEDAGV